MAWAMPRLPARLLWGRGGGGGFMPRPVRGPTHLSALPGWAGLEGSLCPSAFWGP